MADQHFTQVKRNRNPPCTCQHCGKEYTNKRRGSEGKQYCSRECGFSGQRASRALAKAERNAPRLAVEAHTKQIRRLLSLMRDRVRTQTAIELKHEKAAAPCAVCGKPCGYVFGRSRIYCSDACHKASAGFIASRRIHKAMRRARKQQQGADHIDPIKVFDRDGWKCHICNKKLKPNDRGTLKDVAPELEHIVSLADGGSHTWGNVACSCRKCNQAKGARSYGQIGFRFAA